MKDLPSAALPPRTDCIPHPHRHTRKKNKMSALPKCLLQLPGLCLGSAACWRSRVELRPRVLMPSDC